MTKPKLLKLDATRRGWSIGWLQTLPRQTVSRLIIHTARHDTDRTVSSCQAGGVNWALDGDAVAARWWTVRVGCRTRVAALSTARWKPALSEDQISTATYVSFIQYLLLLLLFHHPSLFQSRLKTLLFCKSFPPQPFIFLVRTDYMDSPLLIVTSEHIRFYFLVFLFYTF